MTSSCATSAASDGSVGEYEDLRGRVLAGSTAGRYFDLQLLIREGIAAWITRCSSRVVPHVPPGDPAPRVGIVPMVFDELHAYLVRGLASMALASRREMST